MRIEAGNIIDILTLEYSQICYENIWNLKYNILYIVLCSFTWITNRRNQCCAGFTLHFSVGVYVFVFLNISCLSPFGSHFGIYTRTAMAKISTS